MALPYYFVNDTEITYRTLHVQERLLQAQYLLRRKGITSEFIPSIAHNMVAEQIAAKVGCDCQRMCHMGGLKSLKGHHPSCKGFKPLRYN